MGSEEPVKVTEQYIRDQKLIQYIQCFELNESRYCCLVEGCGSSFISKTTAIKHMRTQHKSLSELIVANKINGLKRGEQGSKDEVEFRVKVKISDLWNSLIRMVSFNSIPFVFFESKGFKDFFKPLKIGLKDCGARFALNSESLKEQVNEKAEAIKMKIRSEVNKKMVCLLLDIASRYNRSVLGVSVAFCCNGKKCIRTLKMHTIKMQQTGKNLFELVQRILDEYKIHLDQVFAVTTDNGKNLKKMTRLMDQALRESCYDIDDENVGDDEEEIEDDNNNDEMDSEDFDDNYFHDLLDDVQNEFNRNIYIKLIPDVSCAAHCLHLVVKDSIKKCTDLSNIIDRCRELCKKLRTPSLRNLLVLDQRKMALIDVQTRWSSLYKMVN